MRSRRRRPPRCRKDVTPLLAARSSSIAPSKSPRPGLRVTPARAAARQRRAAADGLRRQQLRAARDRIANARRPGVRHRTTSTASTSCAAGRRAATSSRGRWPRCCCADPRSRSGRRVSTMTWRRSVLPPGPRLGAGLRQPQPLPVTLPLVDRSRAHVGGTGSPARSARTFRSRDCLPFTDAVRPARPRELALIAAPASGRLRVRLDRMPGLRPTPYTLSVVMPAHEGHAAPVSCSTASAPARSRLLTFAPSGVRTGFDGRRLATPAPAADAPAVTGDRRSGARP